MTATAEPEAPPESLLLDIAQVAALLGGVCERTVERMVAAGAFPAPRKLGRRSLWSRAQVEAWVNDPNPPRPAPRPDRRATPTATTGPVPTPGLASTATTRPPLPLPPTAPAEAPGVALGARSPAPTDEGGPEPRSRNPAHPGRNAGGGAGEPSRSPDTEARP